MIDSFWKEFQNKIPEYSGLKTPQSYYFCDNEKDANECAELVSKSSYDKAENFDNYLNGMDSPIHILVRLNNEIVRWATKFIRDREKWFIIILSSSINGQYIGSKLIDHIKAH